MSVGEGGGDCKVHFNYSAQQNSTNNGEAMRTVGCWLWSCCGGERCSGSDVAVAVAVLVVEGRRKVGSGEARANYSAQRNTTGNGNAMKMIAISGGGGTGGDWGGGRLLAVPSLRLLSVRLLFR